MHGGKCKGVRVCVEWRGCGCVWIAYSYCDFNNDVDWYSTSIHDEIQAPTILKWSVWCVHGMCVEYGVCVSSVECVVCAVECENICEIFSAKLISAC